MGGKKKSESLEILNIGKDVEKRLKSGPSGSRSRDLS